eukprot:2283918-Alexandrium_andersonii.AAC.1
MDRHDLILDDLGCSELHTGLLARTAALRTVASPARLHVRQPRQNVPRAALHGAAPICELGVVNVLSEEGLVGGRVE